jgi:hypothetical protein
MYTSAPPENGRGIAARHIHHGALAAVDCGYAPGNFHGFLPQYSKTDNFKVKTPRLRREIDTKFFRDGNGDGHWQDGEPWLDGLAVTWTDPLGASNLKWSYLDLSLAVDHEAHVEAVEPGVHAITIENQVDCAVGLVHLGSIDQSVGPQIVKVDLSALSNSDKDMTVFIYVACAP